jgi:hypothetical protein
VRLDEESWQTLMFVGAIFCFFIGELVPIFVGGSLAEGKRAIVLTIIVDVVLISIGVPIARRFSAPSVLVRRPQSTDRLRDAVAVVALGLASGALGMLKRNRNQV